MIIIFSAISLVLGIAIGIGISKAGQSKLQRSAHQMMVQRRRDLEIPSFDSAGMMIPPWVKYPGMERSDIGWRMGYGEDYMGRWYAWWDEQSDENKAGYQEKYKPEESWEGFYS